MPDVGSELRDALDFLKTAALQLEREISKSVADPDLRLVHLREVVAALGIAKPAQRVHCPEEYVQQWNDYLEGRSESFVRRAVRYLCWQPEVATDKTFQYYLDHEHIPLNARSLQGIVHSCHSRWSPEFAKGQVVTRVRDRLETYKGGNRVVQRWKENSTTVLGPKGAELLGVDMLQKVSAIKSHCEHWGISDETSAYIQAAVCHASQVCRNQMDRVPEMRRYLLDELLPWKGWPPGEFKSEASRTVLHPAASNVAEVRESVTRFVLNDLRLGDPRLPHNRLNWVGMSDAERRVIEWLSQLDIVFFFESVLTKATDRQGRKAFWLQYVPCIENSRTLLNRNDRYRLAATLRERNRELATVGSISGTPSAFLLDFGKVVVVEFSEVGRCYFYEKGAFAKIVPDFLMAQTLRGMDLKDFSLCLTSVVHRKSKSAWHGGGWEEEASQTLARFGIRPGEQS
jgi:hypothetical protein